MMPTVPSTAGSGWDEDDLAARVQDLGEVWRFGLLASRSMADRVFEMYEDLGSSVRRSYAGSEDELRRLRIDMERAVELSLDVFDRVFGLALRFDPRATGESNGDGAAPAELVVSAPAGGRANGRLWVHNVSADTLDAPRLRCGPLESFEGARIPPSCVKVVSAAEPIDGRGSRLVELFADVPPETPVGTYRGLVMTSDPDVFIRCRLDVTPAVVLQADDRGDDRDDS